VNIDINCSMLVKRCSCIRFDAQCILCWYVIGLFNGSPNIKHVWLLYLTYM